MFLGGGISQVSPPPPYEHLVMSSGTCLLQFLLSPLCSRPQVYNVPSSSYYWLCKHVQQAHTKERPHKCFMNGCNLSFASVEALQRHIQRHFKPLSPPPVPKSVRLGLKGHKFPQLVVRAEKLPPTLPAPSDRPLSVSHAVDDEDLPPTKKVCVTLPAVDDLEDVNSEVDSDNRLGKPPSSLLSQQLQRQESGSSSNSGTQPKRRRRLSFKVRIPRHTISCSSSHVRGPTPCNGM